MHVAQCRNRLEPEVQELFPKNGCLLPASNKSKEQMKGGDTDAKTAFRHGIILKSYLMNFRFTLGKPEVMLCINSGLILHLR